MSIPSAALSFIRSPSTASVSCIEVVYYTVTVRLKKAALRLNSFARNMMRPYKTAVIGDIPEGAIWRKVIAKYNRPDFRKSALNLANSVVPYIILWYLMYRFLSVSGFMVRIFIVFHDCGHGSLSTISPGATARMRCSG
jgi:hypothetical protein